jgi:hypothetical protein
MVEQLPPMLDDSIWEDDDEPYEDDPADECGLMHDGQCMLAGTEWCDFECPFRDSPDYAGNRHGLPPPPPC